ncbi:hypothetical protein QTI66_17030 [Variovorax sp. J22R133]|uniref:hypothetical protein n=1 Tax=Variovorax brevis TaxID=3053503 RepID=UPI0025789D95|nr:hypothetical protein [Variovorax sp. J22R133]MDM0113866.1 hypothetical protein [Variovorax sp. J22R133]
MDKTPEQIKASLKWEAACERLAFVMAPPAGQPIAGAPDLESAIAFAQAALEDIRRAFGSGDADKSPA